MHSEDKKVINKNEEQKLISDEKKNLETFIDGVEYGVTNNGCIYYETSKGKQIIVCNFFMQLLSINDDLSDNRSYTFNIILQEGRAKKGIVLNNYNLKNSRWIDELGIEYHLGRYAKYKDLKIYISNLIVENMPNSNEELIQDTITKIKDITKIDTNKDYTLGKNFLLGISRLLETDNNEYIASSRDNIDMSDSSKLLGFRECDGDRFKEEYYLKMDKVIRKIRNFNDLFNEELKSKLTNYKNIYSQLAELGVLIVNRDREKDKVSPTKLVIINSKPIRFFRVNINKLTELVKECIEEIEFLDGVAYKNISDEILTIYPILSKIQIEDELNKLIKKNFNTKSEFKITKYRKGFWIGIEEQDGDLYNYIDKLCLELKIQSNLNVGVTDENIESYVNSFDVDIENKYERAGFIEGLKMQIKQEIAKKQIEEENLKLENKDTIITND